MKKTVGIMLMVFFLAACGKKTDWIEPKSNSSVVNNTVSNVYIQEITTPSGKFCVVGSGSNNGSLSIFCFKD